MLFSSPSREQGRISLSTIFNVIGSAQPAQEYIALAADEHNRFIVEKPCRLANLPENRLKNRYANVVPYDDSAIVLSDGTFVNASRIPGCDRDCVFVSTAYIATQGPLDNTQDDFYRMILEYKVGVIVMLTGVVEGDQAKCVAYWPRSDNTMRKSARTEEPLVLGDAEDAYCIKEPVLSLASVEVRNVKEVVTGNIIMRELSVTPKNDRDRHHRVVQYQYKGWPDHDVPKDSKDIREIVRLVEEERKNDVDPRRPIVVHCSAGLGRTGTFIAIHQNMIRMNKAISAGNFDAKNYYINLYQDVLQMRGCRSGMVQQPAQYFFCYKAIAEEAVERNLISDDTPRRRPYDFSSASSDEEERDDDDDDKMLDEDAPITFPTAPQRRRNSRFLLSQSTRNHTATGSILRRTTLADSEINSDSDSDDLSMSRMADPRVSKRRF